MFVTIHRGSNEVGGNCIEISDDNDRLILDAGMPLFDAERAPIDTQSFRRQATSKLHDMAIIPRIPGLFDQEHAAPLAIFLSHAHLDHCGLISHSRDDVPVYASRGTSKMMLAASLFAGQTRLPAERFREVTPGQEIQLGPFLIHGLSVDHSIYGCLAFLIEVHGKTVFYSGDLRLHGRKPGMHQHLIKTLRNRSIDLMLMEGTHFSFDDGNLWTEYELEQQIVDRVKQSSSLVLASFSPLHIDRLVCFIRAAVQSGRQLVTDVYSAFVLYLLGNELSLPKFQAGGLLRLLVTHDRDEQMLNRLTALKNGCDAFRVTTSELAAQPQKYLLIFRPMMLSAFEHGLPPESTCIYSRWHGYLDSRDWQTVASHLQQRQGKLIDLHTSGHIFASNIKQFVSAINPQSLVPIHTFDGERFMQEFPQAKCPGDGVPIEV